MLVELNDDVGSNHVGVHGRGGHDGHLAAHVLCIDRREELALGGQLARIFLCTN